MYEELEAAARAPLALPGLPATQPWNSEMRLVDGDEMVAMRDEILLLIAKARMADQMARVLAGVEKARWVKDEYLEPEDLAVRRALAAYEALGAGP